MLKKDGTKYVDQSRFPKVVTNGYEAEIKKDYDNTLKNMLKDISVKLVEFTKTKK